MATVARSATVEVGDTSLSGLKTGWKFFRGQEGIDILRVIYIYNVTGRSIKELLNIEKFTEWEYNGKKVKVITPDQFITLTRKLAFIDNREAQSMLAQMNYPKARI